MGVPGNEKHLGMSLENRSTQRLSLATKNKWGDRLKRSILGMSLERRSTLRVSLATGGGCPPPTQVICRVDLGGAGPPALYCDKSALHRL